MYTHHQAHQELGCLVADLMYRAVELEFEGILGGVGVGENVPTPTLA
jgi:hypothetical protein